MLSSMNVSGNLIEKAAHIAVVAHEGQTRKGEPMPYVVHTFMVAHKVSQHGFNDRVIAAALTHDVLEDTDFGEVLLLEALGEEVVLLVKTLSEDKTLPWKERKQLYIETVGKGSDEAKAISAADKIHNLESIIRAHKEGHDVWDMLAHTKDEQVWFAEAELAMLQDSWEHVLVDEYAQLVERMKMLE